MNEIPLLSTFTLITETFLTAAVWYILYSGYRKNRFPTKLTAFILVYEVLFNISYMFYRALTHGSERGFQHSSYYVGLAVFHGTFSLIMFVFLLAFMWIAWKRYSAGINFFREHKKITICFLFSWMVAVISGYLFYYEMYMNPEEHTGQSSQSQIY